ncbi:biliverdin-producing heme oxygenase [Magnetovibrio blakemorei]|uniref:Heme oxygenase n=1 Tax=Magnetovibrio blakemorei TaxID=28181 RepID=A0A1E5Q814_9PROT|nr:biliverdin-producing heme oxygenase [Magnetovibrio blakemorei]OEJ67382.1 hypothetical protein BEN30_09635 [Magnetovibrio blakemorei]
MHFTALHDLRTGTKQLHEAIESVPILQELASGQITPQRYKRVLSAFIGFWGPVEHGLAQQSLPIDWKARVPNLRNDLQALGCSPEEIKTIAECPFIPQPVDIEGGLGVLYVLNGSRLGGAVIHKALRAKGSIPDDCMSYFAAPSETLSSDWKIFTKGIELSIQTEAGVRSASASARETFLALMTWILLCQS